MKPWPIVVASLMLVGTLGLLHSLSHGELIPTKQPFSTFPLILADRWEGEELGMEQDILDVLKVSDYMVRVYQPKKTAHHAETEPVLTPVSLYVGYYESQRTGATYHSPKNCLPGAGWNFAEITTVAIPLQHNGQTIHINKVLIQKGLEQQLVLYWYQDRGRVIASEYWAKGYMIWDAMMKNRTDGALVRIIVPVSTTTEQAFQVGVTFLNDMWPDLLTHMPPAAMT